VQLQEYSPAAEDTQMHFIENQPIKDPLDHLQNNHQTFQDRPLIGNQPDASDDDAISSCNSEEGMEEYPYENQTLRDGAAETNLPGS